MIEDGILSIVHEPDSVVENATTGGSNAKSENEKDDRTDNERNENEISSSLGNDAASEPIETVSTEDSITPTSSHVVDVSEAGVNSSNQNTWTQQELSTYGQAEPHGADWIRQTGELKLWHYLERAFASEAHCWACPGDGCNQRIWSVWMPNRCHACGTIGRCKVDDTRLLVFRSPLQGGLVTEQEHSRWVKLMGCTRCGRHEC